MTANANAWMGALLQRHVEPLGRPAFLKAVRALSARYVERRDLLPTRSAVDSAGKRAAFAAFFAPRHFAAVQAAVALNRMNAWPVETIVDLGCGTGAAGAAWATILPGPVLLKGIDVNPWCVSEANWTWRTIGLEGHARRGDIVKTCARMLRMSRRTPLNGTAIVLAWAVNELDAAGRRTLLPLLLDLARRGSSVLVIEPIGRRATPWWDEWAATFGEARGVAEDFHLSVGGEDPPRELGWLGDLHREAGLGFDELGMRSLSIQGPPRQK